MISLSSCCGTDTHVGWTNARRCTYKTRNSDETRRNRHLCTDTKTKKKKTQLFLSLARSKRGDTRAWTHMLSHAYTCCAFPAFRNRFRPIVKAALHVRVGRAQEISRSDKGSGQTRLELTFYRNRHTTVLHGLEFANGHRRGIFKARYFRLQIPSGVD